MMMVNVVLHDTRKASMRIYNVGLPRIFCSTASTFAEEKCASCQLVIANIGGGANESSTNHPTLQSIYLFRFETLSISLQDFFYYALLSLFIFSLFNYSLTSVPS
jgi:hypothetical protein